MVPPATVYPPAEVLLPFKVRVFPLIFWRMAVELAPLTTPELVMLPNSVSIDPVTPELTVIGRDEEAIAAEGCSVPFPLKTTGTELPPSEVSAEKLSVPPAISVWLLEPP